MAALRRASLLACLVALSAASVWVYASEIPGVKVEFLARFPKVQRAYDHSQQLLHNFTSDGLGQWLPAKSQTVKSKEQTLHEIYEEDVWKNDLILFFLPAETRAAIPHFFQTWLRCFVAATAVYFVLGGLWAYYIYFAFRTQLFGSNQIPALEDVWEQIKVSMWAMPLYSLLPAVTEYMCEQGWTRVYTRVADAGFPRYFGHFLVYMAFVEFFVYWNHRSLHEVKFLYKWLHHIHHKYNKEHTLSPFAGLAFHPLDGIIQAIPYTFMLFFTPMHFLTHELLLFATGIWTTSIHDCIHARVWPVMGAGYHTIHHTTYKHNYGQMLVYTDWLFGTMITPEDYEAELQAGKKDT